MKKLTICGAICVFIILFTLVSSASAQEPLLTYDKIQKLDKGRKVYLNSILSDGRFLMISEDPGGHSRRLLLLSPGGSLLRRMDLPFGRVEYVAASSGNSPVLVYSQERFSFYRVDLRNRKWKIITSRAGAQGGFALFGGKKSKLMASGDLFHVWGYFYDTAGEYASEWLVLLNPSVSGPDSVTRLVEMSGLAEKACRMASVDGVIDFVRADGDWLVFTITGDEGRGTLFGYRFSSGELFVIESFSSFYGADVSSSAGKTAYVIEPLGENSPRVLFVYDFESRLPAKALPGEFFNPVFSSDANRLAVGKSVSALNRVVASGIVIVPLLPAGAAGYPLKLSGQLIDWKFTGKDSLTVVSREGNIYRLKI